MLLAEDNRVNQLLATRLLERAGHDVVLAETGRAAVAAHAMKGDRERCLAEDMDDYVSKPITPGVLFEVIDRVLLAGTTPAAV